jgi:MFS family permease
MTSLGGILAPVYAGVMFDVYGAMGYRIAFGTLAVPAILSIFLYLSMKRPTLPEESVPVGAERTAT